MTMDQATAATVHEKLMQAQECIIEAFVVADQAASDDEVQKLEQQLTADIKQAQTTLEAIRGDYPTLRPPASGTESWKRAFPERSLPPKRNEPIAADGALLRDAALCAQQQLFDACELLNASVFTVMANLRADELLQYKHCIGFSMAEVDEALRWLWARHRDIMPAALRNNREAGAQPTTGEDAPVK
jgi:hypothetical protein